MFFSRTLENLHAVLETSLAGTHTCAAGIPISWQCSAVPQCSAALPHVRDNPAYIHDDSLNYYMHKTGCSSECSGLECSPHQLLNQPSNTHNVLLCAVNQHTAAVCWTWVDPVWWFCYFPAHWEYCNTSLAPVSTHLSLLAGSVFRRQRMRFQLSNDVYSEGSEDCVAGMSQGSHFPALHFSPTL